MVNNMFAWFARLIIAMTVLPAMASTYYVDSVAGNDANSGTSSNAAWSSLAKINGTTFAPGDFLLLKNGSSWTGTLSPLGSGTSGNPIKLSSYGTNSSRPLINGNGATDAVLLNNQQYWEISNLEVINPGSGTSTERRGIHLAAANFGVVNHLYVSNCFVHNICGRVDTSNGDLVAKRTGGIVVEVTSESGTATRFNDITIQNCTILSVTNQGIVACANRSSTSDYPGTSAWNTHYCSNLHIRNNVISDICKNAMSIRYADASCVVEHNLMHDTANTTDGNQICSYSSRGAVFQYNEGYHNNGDGLHDGSLYDADLRSPQTVWQFSYSHDNSWGLFVQYASADTAGNAVGNDTHIVVRYNISQNDQGDIFGLSGDGGTTASDYIYNNTIYTPSNLSPVFFDDRATGHSYYVYNNVFYNLSSTASWNFTSGNTRTFNYNLFYGQHVSGEPSDANKLTSNPLLVAPGTGGGVGGTTNMSTLGGYLLQAGSPCIDSGLLVTTAMTGNTNAGGLDFFGNLVPNVGQPDRGAAEWVTPVSSNSPPTYALQSGSSTRLPNSIALVGTVNPGGAIAQCYYAFGTSTGYGNFSGTNVIQAGTNSVAVTNLISGLLPATTYHFQALVTNSVGGTNTSDFTVSTTSITTPMINSSLINSNGNFQCTFTNTPGASFEMLGTTNPALPRTSWQVLGPVTEILAGQYQFIDAQAPTNEPLEFYMIRSP